MPLETGQTLLHYRLVEQIGEGGMGVVWKARDTSLDREVAIKVLPDAFSQDTERLARFEREARLLASLRHANIAAVHGLHEDAGVRFLAMELVEGEDLAQRLARGALPMDEALEIGRSIAEAMEAAHEQGVIHRDLKPANVKVAPDGTVKVLDFGLAKAMEAGTGQSAESQLANSPTMTQAATAMGVILGTASYMAPEQAKGKTVDKRADIWAFGVMLTEILTGRRMFEGETAAEILGGVFRQEIRLDELPASTPRRVRVLLERCLERDPKRRLRDIGEARIVLSEVDEAPGAEAPASEHGPAKVSPAGRLWPVLVLLGLVAGAVGGWMSKPTPTQPLRKLSLAAPEGMEDPRMSPRISPDGRAMAYVADRQLWIQDLDQLSARPVTGGADAEQFDWSPDGRSLAFTVHTRLWRTGMSGDPALIADLPVAVSSRGGALCWTANDTIVYSTGDNNLFEVPVTGGFPEVLLAPDPAREADFHEPSALPEGRGILYVVHRVPQGVDTLEVLADGRRKVVFQDDGASIFSPVYAPTGHILFERRDASPGIWSLPFALSDLEASGPPVLVTSAGSHPSVSRDGSLLYSNLASAGNDRLVFVDRDGMILEELGDPLQHADNARLSPDGRMLGVCVDEGRDNNLWIHDLVRGSRTRLVFQSECGGRNGDLAWSPDSSSVVFGDTAAKALRQVRVDGAGETRVLTEGLHAEFGPDGRSLIFARESATNGVDIWTLALDGAAEPQPFVATRAREDMPRLSPNGDLLAYVSDETGRAEVYLRPFPSGAGKWQVSAHGGDFPRWSPSGERLFYLQDETSLIEVAVTVQPTIQLGRAQEVFAYAAQQLGPSHGYDVAIGDDRFVMLRFGEATTGAGDLTLITSWPGN